MQSESTPDYKQLYETMAAMGESIRRVAQGLCPKCGAEREDDNCRACGHRSVYVKPFLPRRRSRPSPDLLSTERSHPPIEKGRPV